jgi:NitT/TauT family transport system permease protein
MTRLQRALWGAGFAIGLLLLWAAVSSLPGMPAYRFPGPGAIAGAFAGLWHRGELGPALAGSLRRMAFGYGISLVAGVATGLLLTASRTLDATLGVLLLGLQTLPSICWLPVAILWFGLGEPAILFVVIAGAFLAVATAARDGFKRVPPELLRAGRCLGATGIGLWVRVVLPAATPALLTGAKLGWAFAWRALMAGELLGAGTAGLGQTLTLARELNDLPRVFAVMAVIMMLGLVADKGLFSPAERAVARRWGTAV